MLRTSRRAPPRARWNRAGPAPPAPLTHAETLSRLAEAEAALRAIGAGEVDAFVISDGADGARVFTLSSADHAYRMFVENMLEGAATLSSGGLILYANPRLAQLLSCPRESIVGRPLVDFVDGALPGPLSASEGRDGLRTRVELDLVGDTGLLVPVLVGASPLEIDGARLTCLTFTDLTEQKAQEREIARLILAEAERSQRFAASLAETQNLEALGVLAGGIAHDFNNLLTVIVGSTTVALATLAPDAPERDPLEQVQLAATRSTDLARQMLAYSGKGRFVVEVVSLAEVVGGLTELIKAAISKKSALSFGFEPGAPAIEADTTQLRQVILNLITNASDAIGEIDGTIEVRAGPVRADRAFLSEYEFSKELPEGDYAFLEISDTGSGMDAATKARIFDPFFTTKFTGRGLGLAAVQGIVRGHHGAMKVHSVPGVGTTFTVLFPASAKPLPATAEVTAGPALDAASGTVLVVDDDDAVRRMAIRMLESLGFTAISAADGAEGLAILVERGDELSFVLLDLTMPGMNGEEVMAELERIGATVPVILSSGYDSKEISERFGGRRVAANLQKPYGKDDLSAAASRALAEHAIMNLHRGEAS